jgi:hypothetical protein
MWWSLVVALCLQAAVSLHRPSPPRSLTRCSIGGLRMLADGEAFGPHFDPATGFASIGIIVSYSYMQLKLRENSQLQDSILRLEWELQQAKAKQLSGGAEEQIDVARRVRELEELLRREKETKTFIDLPGLQMNFRVPNRIQDVQRPSSSTASSASAPAVVKEGDEDEMYSFNAEPVLVEEPPREASPLTQKVLVVVGVGVVLALAYTLVVLSSDPITSTTSLYTVPGNF